MAQRGGGLVGGMAGGGEGSFAALYRRRQGGVYRFGVQMTGSGQAAEDVTQEVFLELIKSGRRFDVARGTLLSFLYGIARNLILRKLEKDRNTGSAVEQEVACDEDLLGDLTRRETIERVRRAVLSLPPGYREVVALCALDDASIGEAAGALDFPGGR